jgi:hypothetical protein
VTLLLLWLQGCHPASLRPCSLQHAYHGQMPCKEDERMREWALDGPLSHAAALVCCAAWVRLGACADCSIPASSAADW